ncbi:MAG: YgjV family protein [Gemmatimonadota bacterium]
MSAAHLIGGAGFVVLLVATQVGSRARFLAVDFCGLGAVVAHYILLDAPTGAAMSALYMAIDVTSGLRDRSELARRGFVAHYGLAVLLVAFTYRGPADLAALFGTLAAVASRQRDEMRPLLLLLVVSSVGWGAYGALVGSVSQVSFSAAYATFSLLGVWRLERQTHA